jgi:hypothetical protein
MTADEFHGKWGPDPEERMMGNLAAAFARDLALLLETAREGERKRCVAAADAWVLSYPLRTVMATAEDYVAIKEQVQAGIVKALSALPPEPAPMPDPTAEDLQRAALLLRDWRHRFGICFSDAGEGGLTVPLALALGEVRREERAACRAAVQQALAGVVDDDSRWVMRVALESLK